MGLALDSNRTPTHNNRLTPYGGGNQSGAGVLHTQQDVHSNNQSFYNEQQQRQVPNNYNVGSFAARVSQQQASPNNRAGQKNSSYFPSASRNSRGMQYRDPEVCSRGRQFINDVSHQNYQDSNNDVDSRGTPNYSIAMSQFHGEGATGYQAGASPSEAGDVRSNRNYRGNNTKQQNSSRMAPSTFQARASAARRAYQFDNNTSCFQEEDEEIYSEEQLPSLHTVPDEEVMIEVNRGIGMEQTAVFTNHNLFQLQHVGDKQGQGGPQVACGLIRDNISDNSLFPYETLKDGKAQIFESGGRSKLLPLSVDKDIGQHCDSNKKQNRRAADEDIEMSPIKTDEIQIEVLVQMAHDRKNHANRRRNQEESKEVRNKSQQQPKDQKGGLSPTSPTNYHHNNNKARGQASSVARARRNTDMNQAHLSEQVQFGQRGITVMPLSNEASEHDNKPRHLAPYLENLPNTLQKKDSQEINESVDCPTGTYQMKSGRKTSQQQLLSHPSNNYSNQLSSKLDNNAFYSKQVNLAFGSKGTGGGLLNNNGGNADASKRQKLRGGAAYGDSIQRDLGEAFKLNQASHSYGNNKPLTMEVQDDQKPHRNSLVNAINAHRYNANSGLPNQGAGASAKQPLCGQYLSKMQHTPSGQTPPASHISRNKRDSQAPYNNVDSLKLPNSRRKSRMHTGTGEQIEIDEEISFDLSNDEDGGVGAANQYENALIGSKKGSNQNRSRGAGMGVQNQQQQRDIAHMWGQLKGDGGRPTYDQNSIDNQFPKYSQTNVSQFYKNHVDRILNASSDGGGNSPSPFNRMQTKRIGFQMQKTLRHHGQSSINDDTNTYLTHLNTKLNEQLNEGGGGGFRDSVRIETMENQGNSGIGNSGRLFNRDSGRYQQQVKNSSFLGVESPHKPLMNNEKDGESGEERMKTASASFMQDSFELKIDGDKNEEKKNNEAFDLTATFDFLRHYEEKSFNYFEIESQVRVNISQFIRTKYFEVFMLLCIFTNCVALALYEYELDWRSQEEKNFHQQRTICDYVNLTFTAVFIVEFFLKSIVKGMFIHKRSHVRSYWTILDLLVIIPGLIEIFIIPHTSLTLRVFRMLFRPLKTFNAFHSMKKLAKSLVDTLPDFANVGVFLVFIFVLFATMGVQQYAGQGYNSCRYSEHPDNLTNTWPSDLSFNRPCSLNDFGEFTCPSNRHCGNIQDYPEISFDSEKFEDREYLNFGITNFDHLGTSLLTVFQMITSETWQQQLFNLMDVDLPFIGALYCFSIIIIGQIFLLNLILAVIIQAFMKAHQKQIEEDIKDLEIWEDVFSSESTISSSSVQSEENGTVEENENEEDDYGNENDEEEEGNNGRRKHLYIKGFTHDKIDEQRDDDEESKSEEHNEEEDDDEDGKITEVHKKKNRGHRTEVYSRGALGKSDEDDDVDDYDGSGGTQSIGSQRRLKQSTKRRTDSDGEVNDIDEEDDEDGEENFKKIEEQKTSQMPKEMTMIEEGGLTSNIEKTINGEAPMSRASPEGTSTFSGFKMVSASHEPRGTVIRRQKSKITPVFKRSHTALSQGVKRFKKGKIPSTITALKLSKKKSIRSRKSKKSGKLSSKKPRLMQNMGDLVRADARLEEQEKKYDENEGFHEFLRKMAITRKIANIFTDMRINKLKKKKTEHPERGHGKQAGHKPSHLELDLYGQTKFLLTPYPPPPSQQIPSGGIQANAGALPPVNKNAVLNLARGITQGGFIGQITQRKFPEHSKTMHESRTIIHDSRKITSNIQEEKTSQTQSRGLTNVLAPVSAEGENVSLMMVHPQMTDGDENAGSTTIQKRKILSGLRPSEPSHSNISDNINPFRSFKTGLSLGLSNTKGPFPVNWKHAFNNTLTMKERAKSRRSSNRDFIKNKTFLSAPINFQQNEIIQKMKTRLKKRIEAAEKGTLLTKHTKTVPPKNIQNDNLKELLNKKFILEVKKNMINNLIAVAVQKNIITERRKSHKLIDLFFSIQRNPFFSAFMQILVIANLISISFDHYPIEISKLTMIETWNIIFTFAYILEFIIKVVGLGYIGFFKESGFNIYDTIIAFIGLLDIIVINIYLFQTPTIDHGIILYNSEIITVFRALRSLRIFKLARYWRGFRILLETFWMTVVSIYPFTCLLLIVLFTYALIGLEFFANRAKINPYTKHVDTVHGRSPSFNFDTFVDSFLTVFIVFTNDGQSKVFYDYYRAVDPISSTFYWVTFVVLAQKILLNVFIAIILQKFNELNLKNEIQRIEEESFETNTNLIKQLRELCIKLWARYKKYKAAKEGKNGETDDSLAEDSVGAGVSISGAGQSMSLDNEMMSESSKKHEESPQHQEIAVEIAKSQPNKDLLKFRRAFSYISESQKKHGDRSLGFFDHDHWLRSFLHDFLGHRRYENFILVCILITAVQLALEIPTIDPASTLKSVLVWINYVTLTIFTIEFFAKIVIYGFLFNGPHSYLKNVWNVNDFIILIFSYLYLSSLATSFKFVKTLKFMKALRLISRNQGLQIAVRALLFAIPYVIKFTLIMCLFYLVFAVVLISYFKGKLSYCNGVSDEDLLGLDDKWDCMDFGGEWLSRIYNFDNFLSSLITLFVMSTTSGWSEIMNNTLASRNVDLIPRSLLDHEFRHPVWILFFILFILVGGFFFLNLFVGVVLNTFYTQTEKVGGGELLTEKQKTYIDTRLLVLRSAPIIKIKPPENKIRRICYYLYQRPIFERFIQLCILGNTIILMLEWYRQSDQMNQIAEIMNQVFTLIFVCEAAIRIFAIGFGHYFKDGWNIFDLLIALGSLVGIFISQGTSLQIKGTSILRAFRILRLVRLLKRGGQSLNQIFNTFVITMQTMTNIGALLILFTYIYSIVGMMFFGEVKRTGNMNDYINFETFTSAFITLLTVSTGDNWHATMESFAKTRSPSYDCINDPDFYDYRDNGHQTVGCGNRAGSFIFFVSFNFLVRLVFLKLFIAVILEGYLKTQIQDSRLFNNEQKEKFRQVWAEYDPDATSFIKLRDLRYFLFALGAPLGFDDTFLNSRFLQDKFIASLELPTYQGFHYYQFLDVLDALSFRLMVMDHFNKIEEDLAKPNSTVGGGGIGGIGGGGFADSMNPAFQSQAGMRDIEQEVNRLIYQKQSENIHAFKELWEKEQLNQRSRMFLRDSRGLSSSHHMAIEAIIRRVKVRWFKRDHPSQDGDTPKKDGGLAQFEVASNLTPMIGKPQSKTGNLNSMNFGGESIRELTTPQFIR